MAVTSEDTIRKDVADVISLAVRNYMSTMRGANQIKSFMKKDYGVQITTSTDRALNVVVGKFLRDRD